LQYFIGRQKKKKGETLLGDMPYQYKSKPIRLDHVGLYFERTDTGRGHALTLISRAGICGYSTG
ncbi:hypothetical protein P7M34_24565, partial [Vibrio parahaemolyticus]|nr:hypothetical protein [Vibrio parahaemolyticus]